VSILPHIVNLDIAKTSSGQNPLEALPVGFIVESVKVTEIVEDQGAYVDVGVGGVKGFVHVLSAPEQSDNRFLVSLMSESIIFFQILDLLKYRPYTGDVSQATILLITYFCCLSNYISSINHS